MLCLFVDKIVDDIKYLAWKKFSAWITRRLKLKVYVHGNFYSINKLNIKTMNSGKAFLAVLVGITACVTLGMLFAPEKGSNTRKNIVEKGDDLANTLNEKIDEKFDELLNVINGRVKQNKSQNVPVSSTQEEMAD